MTPADALARYIQIAPRLPTAHFPATSVYANHLGELNDDIDCFVLDGFGVLNVGDAPVPGARERVAALRDAGKQVYVLTNGASYPSLKTVSKYARWEMDFAPSEVISSRDALSRRLSLQPELQWAFAGLPGSALDTLAPSAYLLGDNPDDFARAEGFVLLGTGEWTESRQAMLQDALREHPRPVLVGNPDLVAPWKERLSLEPGLYAHALQDAGVCVPEFCGKPFDDAFDIVRERLADAGHGALDPSRIAMVGDTLHTDILGGAQAGWRTVLVVDHGLMSTLDVDAAIATSGIRPDYIVPTT